MNLKIQDATDSNILGSRTLYRDSDERSRHLNTVKYLAEEINEPLEEIAEVYEDILSKYKQESTVQDFLTVLVSKKLKQIYRANHIT